MDKSLPFPPAFCDRLSGLSAALQVDDSDFFPTRTHFGCRVNTLLATHAAVEAAWHTHGVDFQTISGLPHVYLIPMAHRQSLVDSMQVSSGQVYVQDVASMLPVLLLSPQPGEEVLDLCAAPGSKTTQMAAMMQNAGRIAAVERSKPRFFKLKRICKSHGATCVDTYLKNGCDVWRHCADRFDRVLVDVPCSSESRFNPDDADSYQDWSLKKVKRLQREQVRLLTSAMRCVKSSGTVVYSTCTFSPEENEWVVQRCLDANPGFQLQSSSVSLPNVVPGIGGWEKHVFASGRDCLRVLPTTQMSGFFMARLLRTQ